MALGQMAQDFRAEPRKPCITGIKWLFFYETPEGKYEAETISMDYIIFSDFLNYPSLGGVKSQLAWAKRPNTAWKRVEVRGGIKIKLEYFNKKTMVRVRKVFIS
jgi:hypothetical protein